MNVKKYITWEICIAICITLMACITRLSMALGQVFYGVAILLTIFYMYKQRTQLQVPSFFKSYSIAYGLMLFSLLPAALLTGAPVTGFMEFVNVWIWRVLPFFIIAIVLRDEHIIYKMLACFFVVFGIDNIVAFIQPLIQYTGVGEDNRGWGFGSSTLTIAGIMVMVVPVLVVTFLDNKYPKYLRNSALFCLVCTFFGMYGNKSRAAWLINFITMPLVALKYITKSWKAIAIIVLIVLAIVGLSLQPAKEQRFTTLFDFDSNGSNLGRLYVATSALEMFEDHPFTGVGIGQWRNIYENGYRLPEETQHLYHAHNNFLQLLSETGIVGTLGVTLCFLFIFCDVFRRWRITKNPSYLSTLFVIAGYIFIFGQAEYTLDNSSGMRILWFLAGSLLMLGEKDYSKILMSKQ